MPQSFNRQLGNVKRKLAVTQTQFARATKCLADLGTDIYKLKELASDMEGSPRKRQGAKPSRKKKGKPGPKPKNRLGRPPGSRNKAKRKRRPLTPEGFPIPAASANQAPLDSDQAQTDNGQQSSGEHQAGYTDPLPEDNIHAESEPVTGGFGSSWK